jgi:hypothetical protein
MCIPSLTAAAVLPTSRWGELGGSGGWGGEAAKQGKSPFTAKNTAVYWPIVGLTDL